MLVAMNIAIAIVVLLSSALAFAEEPGQLLFNGKNLDGWEPRGNCSWTVLKDGVLLGQRVHPDDRNPFGTEWPVDQKRYGRWVGTQAWLYTLREFTEFDLHVEYWIPPGGNSGVSIRDRSRAHYAIREPDAGHEKLLTAPLTGSPAHIGYEIQILDATKDRYQTGSIYLFSAAKTGFQLAGDWNAMDISVRNELIRVSLNGNVVAESPGDPARSKTGPIGLQLHDQYSWIFFRNIRIHEVATKQ